MTKIENTQSINFGVVDNISPTTPKVNVDTSKWANKNVNVSITSGIDNESGVDYTEYRINNGNWFKYESPITISSEGESKIDSRTVDKAGNRSPIASGTVRIDRTPPSVNIIPNITEKTHKDVVLTVRASDNLSGVNKITYIGENMIDNGDFSRGLDNWTNHYYTNGDEFEGKIEFRDGNIFLESDVQLNKAKQQNAFKGSAIGAEYYAEITARGNGTLNARYGAPGSIPQKNYAQNITDETSFKIYRFKMERGESSSNQFIMEKIGPEGWIEIKDVKVFASKDISNNELTVTNNGNHTFVVEDHAGNITTKSHNVNNIVRELKLEAPKMIGNAEVEINPEMKLETSIDNMKITDWRDEINDWNLSMSASQIKSDSHALPKGSLEFSGIDKIGKLDGDKSGSMSISDSYKIIDDGKIEIISAINERGVYDIEFKDNTLKFNLSPSTVKKGTYSTTLTWTLESTPKAN